MQATTGIDRVAQANNAYVLLDILAPLATDYVSQYMVTYNQTGLTTAKNTVFAMANAKGTSVKIPNLIPGQSYDIIVYAMTVTGTPSAASATLTVTTAADTTAPAVPTNVAISLGLRGGIISWTAVTAVTDADLQGYEVQVAQSGANFNIVNLGGPILTNTYQYAFPSGTAVGTPLSAQVRAVDWSGNKSAWSATSTIKPSDGVFFDELQVGNLIATGTVTTGKLQAGTPGAAQWIIDSDSVRCNDGTGTDYGKGVGVTTRLGADGNAFFSGTVAASIVQGSYVQGAAGGASGTGARMWMDFVSLVAGTGPLLSVNDGTVNRVQIGNLAANGVSLAQIGIRVNDASGSPLFDSLGLIKAATIVGSYNDTTLGGGNQSLSLSGWTVLNNLSIAVAPTRTTSYMVFCTISGFQAITSTGVYFDAHSSNFQLNVPGVGVLTQGWVTPANNGASQPYATTTIIGSVSLAAGPYSIQAEMMPGGAGSPSTVAAFFCSSRCIYVLQLGS